jgi:Cu/Ag efflux protein CusF
VLQTQGQQRSVTGRRTHFIGSNYHEAVCPLWNQKPLVTLIPSISSVGRRNMKIAKTIFAGATFILMTWSGAIAQQSLTGTISKVDEANGKIAIQQTQGGTVGANSGAVAEEFKVQDGLLFNAVQPGDKVVFTATEVGGVKTITKLEKQ